MMLWRKQDKAAFYCWTNLANNRICFGTFGRIPGETRGAEER
jgi:hypothetical protein